MLKRAARGERKNLFSLPPFIKAKNVFANIHIHGNAVPPALRTRADNDAVPPQPVPLSKDDLTVIGAAQDEQAAAPAEVKAYEEAAKTTERKSPVFGYLEPDESDMVDKRV